jgi:hypothetical protein
VSDSEDYGFSLDSKTSEFELVVGGSGFVKEGEDDPTTQLYGRLDQAIKTSSVRVLSFEDERILRRWAVEQNIGEGQFSDCLYAWQSQRSVGIESEIRGKALDWLRRGRIGSSKWVDSPKVKNATNIYMQSGFPKHDAELKVKQLLSDASFGVELFNVKEAHQRWRAQVDDYLNHRTKRNSYTDKQFAEMQMFLRNLDLPEELSNTLLRSYLDRKGAKLSKGFLGLF